MKDTTLTQAPPPAGHATSYGLATWRRLRRNRAAMAGLVVLALLTLAAGLAPWIAPYACEEQDLELGAAAPSVHHWMGTDVLGRDLLTRVLYGGRVSLAVGLCATLVSLLIGVTVGAVAGYAGARTDAFLMRLVDVLYTIPFTVFVIVLMVVFGRNFLLLFAAIGAVEWLTMARIVRGQVLSVREQAFVKAAVVLGFSRPRIVVRHILPNVIGPVIVYATLTVPRVMLLESFLSFLGLGVRNSWGLLISNGAEAMEAFPWLMIFPGMVLSAALFSLNFLGDGLRDALDPRCSPRRGPAVSAEG
jgi:oligopeptide transport system permease protein